MKSIETFILNLTDKDLPSCDLETTDRSHLNSLQTSDSNQLKCKSEENELQNNEIPNIQIFKITENTPSRASQNLPSGRKEKLGNLSPMSSYLSSEEVGQMNLSSEDPEKHSSLLLSPSFNYTKSEKSSLGFDSFVSSNILMCSFPGNENEEVRENRKSLEMQRNVNEDIEIKGVNGNWDEWKLKSKQEKEKLMSDIRSYIDAKNNEVSDSSFLFEIGSSPINEEVQSKNRFGCGCSGCIVF